MVDDAPKQIESFTLSLADIGTVDIDKLHMLSMSVRWPHRAEDWAFLRTVGQGLAALDEIGRATASVMWFPQGDSFATIGMVMTSPRLQTHGAGHWLMGHALKRLGQRDLGLNATRAAIRLYRTLGFEKETTVYQHQGEARASVSDLPTEGGWMRPLDAADLPQILVLDRRAAGYDRSALIAELVQRSQVLGHFRNEVLVGFAFCRPFGRGTVVGPVVASCDADAIALVAPFLAQKAGSFVRLDTRLASGAFVVFLEASGLKLFDTVMAMTLGRPWTRPARSDDAPMIYGLSTQATG